MTLKLPQVFGQRDLRWAAKLLGYNTNPKYTIGGYGCLITCLGSYIGETPDAVNNTLIQSQGFQAGGGLFIWGKSTLLGLTQTYSSPSYTGPVTSQGLSKIKELLDGGYPLLCEIDFNPATEGEEMHYVLICGYDNSSVLVADPWTGQIVNLDVYGGPARAIIQFRAYDKKLPIDDNETLPVLKKDFENMRRKCDIYDAIVAKLNVADSQTIVLAEVDKLIGYEDAVAQKDKQLSEARDQIAALQKTASDKQKELEMLQNDMKILSDKVNSAVEQNKLLQQQLADAQTAAQQPILIGWRKVIYNFLIGRK